MSHAFVTVIIPFDPDAVPAVEAALDALGNPAKAGVRAAIGAIGTIPGNPAKAGVRAAIGAIGTIHFMSITVVPGDASDAAHLILEVTVDGSGDAALRAIAGKLEKPLLDLLRTAGVRLGATLVETLQGHAHTLGQSWWSTLGLPFDGTPGMTVRRILQERDLAARVADLLDALPPGLSPLQRLGYVRTVLWDDDAAKWAFVPEPAPCLGAAPESGVAPLVRRFFGDAIANKPFEILAAWRTARALACNLFFTFLWPLVPLFAFGIVCLWYFVSPHVAKWAFWLSLLLAPLAAAIVLTLAYYRLRRHEESDVPVDLEPGDRLVAEVMEHETYSAQNLLYSVSTLKPGMFRRLTLRVAFWSVGLVGYFCRPGLLGTNHVIHFARWMLVPGTDKMLFHSNYDGTWLGYVGDFVQNTAGANGVTAIWSNCREFPRTHDFTIGANDRDRLVRWARRQQRPVHFWYQAYPEVTGDRVRTNAAIRQGIASAETEADAADWLACFGSAPRPPDALETAQIPALAFGGLGRFAHSARIAVTLSGNAQECSYWLKHMEPGIAWGETPDSTSCAMIGLAASALQRIGIPAGELSTFPVAFQQGMTAPNRARALGDEGPQDPTHWSWGGPATDRVDAIVLLYAQSDAELRRLEADVRALTGQLHHKAGATQWLQPLASDGSLKQEAFGFVDGISQPRMRGTRAAQRDTPPNDVVAPGELTLGYPDNLGRFPPTPSIAAWLDPAHLLPDVGPDPWRQRPEFGRNAATGRRDFGRNGTYLVVRQLEQHVGAFRQWLDDATAATQGSPLPKPDAARRQMIAAKVVGRWQNGTSLVRYPDAPGPNAHTDNEFMYGVEDPTASRCPMGAHIRRVNPRDGLARGSNEQHATVNSHRMLRVGRSYDAEKSGDPGLLFMCVNVDIERQFEFVQGSWLLNPSFSGLEHETDPLVGHEAADRRFTLCTAEGPMRLRGLREFVRMRGGGYFFLPGRAAYRFLATFGAQ